MKQKKLFSYIILSVICISFGFTGGYFLGRYVLGQNNFPAQTQSKESDDIYYTQPVVQITPSPIPTIISSYYLLKNENEVLSLYEINGEDSVLIKSININSSVLPSEDREKLKAGIKLPSKEEGFALIEDFSS